MDDQQRLHGWRGAICRTVAPTILCAATILVRRAAAGPATMPAGAPASGPVTAPANPPANVATRAYPGSQRGDLKLTLPAGWVDDADPGARAGAPSTIRIFDESHTFQILLTIIPAPTGVKDFSSMPRLRELADLQGRRLMMNSVETKLDTQELKPQPAAGPTNTGGLFFTLTNKAPAPGAFEFMTNAVLGVGDMMLNVTILTHQKDSAARRAALEMLAAAQQVAPGSAMAGVAAAPGAPKTATPPAGAATTNGGSGSSSKPAGATPPPPAPTTPAPATTRPIPESAPPSQPATQPPPASQLVNGPGGLIASLPARTWAVVVDAPEFIPFEDQFSADGQSRRMSAFDPMRAIMLSIYLEPAPIPTADATVARDFALNRLRNSPSPLKDLKTGEADDRAVLQYMIPDLNQKHVHIYLSREGVWIDVHLAAMSDPGGQVDGLLDLLAKGIRLESPAGK